MSKLMAILPCAAADCDCENFIPPKVGKKCADTECGHPLGAHQPYDSIVAREPSMVKTEAFHHSPNMSNSFQPRSTTTENPKREIIALDDDDLEEVEFISTTGQLVAPRRQSYHRVSMIIGKRLKNNENSIGIEHKSSKQLNFTDEVNRARQRAGEINRKQIRESVSGYGILPMRGPLHSGQISSRHRPLSVRTTIWIKYEGKSMSREGNSQWWTFSLEEKCSDYQDWLIAKVNTHMGWLDRKDKELVKMDISLDRLLSIGEMEARGDPSTIIVPPGGGYWRELLDQLPGFFEELQVNETRRGMKKPKETTLSKSKSLAVVVPVSLKRSHTITSNRTQQSQDSVIKQEFLLNTTSTKRHYKTYPIKSESQTEARISSTEPVTFHSKKFNSKYKSKSSKLRPIEETEQNSNELLNSLFTKPSLSGKIQNATGLGQSKIELNDTERKCLDHAEPSLLLPEEEVFSPNSYRAGKHCDQISQDLQYENTVTSKADSELSVKRFTPKSVRIQDLLNTTAPIRHKNRESRTDESSVSKPESDLDKHHDSNNRLQHFKRTLSDLSPEGKSTQRPLDSEKRACYEE
ncbi:hypothetical protein HOY82DRAFT_543129 [Tuber indicum]|nr:hypothetical protein HOY82DRAFT_543129 [Tuber indicum]